MNCRHCRYPLNNAFLDLGFAPPSNAYLSATLLEQPERYYPLKLFVCEHCWLVQTDDHAVAGDLFSSDYAYFSSVSTSWLKHAANYCAMIVGRLHLDKSSLVIEVASNDGYLLKNFVGMGIPCIGVEPTDSTAEAAERLGIPVIREFFGASLAERLVVQGQLADLILGNNVYAHVPDINDFTRAIRTALKPTGTVTLEFPHLMRLIESTQFDTVYHEHFSYLSLYTVSHIFEAEGLRVLDVEEIPTHGGSLRIYGCHRDDQRPTMRAVTALIEKEVSHGLRDLETYAAFQARCAKIKDDLLLFLIEQKRAGRSVAAYGAAAKGNTLLNYAGVTPDLLPYVCDAAPSKQGKFLPGTHLPILAPSEITKCKPDFVLILPWNIRAEVERQLAEIATWGGKFAVAIPSLQVF